MLEASVVQLSRKGSAAAVLGRVKKTAVLSASALYSSRNRRQLSSYHCTCISSFGGKSKFYD